MRSLPAGTVTLLFADIEGSTTLLRDVGPKEYGAALATYRRILRGAVLQRRGVEVETEGDGFFAAFPSAGQAVSAAADAQAQLCDSGFRVRMGMHTGEPLVVDG